MIAAGAVGWAIAAGGVGFAAAGLAAGVAARAVLARLRRGAAVPAPWCELATAALWAPTGSLWAAGVVSGAWLPALLALGWLAVAASAVDVAHRRLPDALTLTALPTALLLVLPHGWDTALRAAAGAGLLVAVHAAVHLAAPRSLGAGDVKLAGPVGAVVAAGSWAAVPVWAVLAAFLTIVLALLAAAARTCGDRPDVPWRQPGQLDGLPHGVSMLAAGWLVTMGAAVTG